MFLKSDKFTKRDSYLNAFSIRSSSAVIFFMALFLTLLCNSALAEKRLSRTQAGELVYTLIEDGSDYKLLISPANKLSSLSRNLTANVFSVKEPSRLVIDLPGFSAGSQKAVDLRSQYLESLRLGIHSDKTRIVVDIKNNRIPVYDVTADPSLGALVVSFSLSSFAKSNDNRAAFDRSTGMKKDPLQNSSRNISKSVSNPIPVPKVIKSPTPKTPIFSMRNEERKVFSKSPLERAPVAAQNTPKPREEIVITEKVPSREEASNSRAMVEQTREVIEPKQPAVAAAGGLITGILFQAPKDAPLGALVVDGDSLEGYSLNQKGPNLFELVLKDSKLDGSHLTLPQFPPESFKGFEVVLANQVGSNVVVKIYVNDQVKLAPYLAKGKLWLKAS